MLFKKRFSLRRNAVKEALSIVGDNTIKVNQLCDPSCGAIRNRGDHDAAIAVSNEDYVCEILHLQYPEHISDVRLKISFTGRKVRPLAESRECRGVDVASCRVQGVADSVPTPAAVPGTVHQDEGCHAVFPN